MRTERPRAGRATPRSRVRRRRPTRVILAALVVVLAAAGCAEPSPSSGPTPALSPAEYAKVLVSATNEARAEEDLDALAPSQCAERAAQERAAALVGADELVHAPIAGVIADCGEGDSAAENLSRSAATPEQVVEAWVNSPGHRMNLFDESATALAVACVPDGAELLCSQIFLGP